MHYMPSFPVRLLLPVGAEVWLKKLVDLKTDLPNYQETQREAKEELKKIKKSKSWW